MEFCPNCGQANVQRVPEGDNRPRAVCGACSAIHYQNPKMVVGCIVEQDGQILLCKRAIEPRHGYWTVPAGYLELGESTIEGAARETREEALANVEIIAPYSHFDIPHIGQAYLIYRARLSEPDFGAGVESLETQLFAPDAIPWDELAFHAVTFSLRLFCEDLERGSFRHHHGVVRRGADGLTLDDHLAMTVGGPIETAR